MQDAVITTEPIPDGIEVLLCLPHSQRDALGQAKVPGRLPRVPGVHEVEGAALRGGLGVRGPHRGLGRAREEGRAAAGEDEQEQQG